MVESRQLKEKAGRFEPEKLSGNLQPPLTKAHMLRTIFRSAVICITLPDRLPDAPGKTGGNVSSYTTRRRGWQAGRSEHDWRVAIVAEVARTVRIKNKVLSSPQDAHMSANAGFNLSNFENIGTVYRNEKKLGKGGYLGKDDRPFLLEKSYPRWRDDLFLVNTQALFYLWPVFFFFCPVTVCVIFLYVVFFIFFERQN
ncbi:MAG: hypothetical protein K6E31_00790 [bacterium]|nr:hypothetical protein [bacterium]